MSTSAENSPAAPRRRKVRRTPGISCEGRDHLEPPTTTTDRGAADDDAAPRHQPPFVCFIPSFDSVVATPTPLSPAALPLRQIVRPTLAAALEHSARRAWDGALRTPSSRHGC